MPVQSAPVSVPHSTSEPDRLLEDIIREIVGDAAVETVSSLHSARAAADSTPAVARSAATVEYVELSTTLPPTAPTAVTVETNTEQRDESALVDESLIESTPNATESESSVVGDQRQPAPFPGSGPVETTLVDASSVDASSVDTSPVDEDAIVPEALDVTPNALVVDVSRETTDELHDPEVDPQTLGGALVDPHSPLAPVPAVLLPQSQGTHAPGVSRETPSEYGGTPLADQIADETRRRIALETAVLPLPANTRVFTISNQKGGVGKTTTAVNLAAALARSGAHVLVVDLDPQGNASTALGVDHRSDQKSVYEVLVADLELAEVVRPSTEHERLDCVPATIHLAGAEIELVSLVAREQRLRRAIDKHLAQMSRPYDYVFIDCPPSLGLLTINAFVAAREVLIPIQCEYYALEGLSQLLSNIELIEKHLNPELRLSTILLTMYDSRTNLAQQVAQEVRDHFPEQTLETIIPRSVRVSEAPSYGQSVISYDYSSSGSLSYREAAAEIAQRAAIAALEAQKEGI